MYFEMVLFSFVIMVVMLVFKMWYIFKPFEEKTRGVIFLSAPLIISLFCMFLTFVGTIGALESTTTIVSGTTTTTITSNDYYPMMWIMKIEGFLLSVIFVLTAIDFFIYIVESPFRKPEKIKPIY